MASDPLPLHCHPAQPCPWVEALESQICLEGGALVLTFQLKGNLEGLRIPALGPVRRADRLWEGTCFEAFLRPAGGEAYVELNLAPSAAWAAYAFDGTRRGMRDLDLAPDLRLKRGKDLVALRARIPLADLPGCAEASGLEVNLAAVVQEAEGGVSHWCLQPRGERPDFHAPEGFLLRLEGEGA